MPEGHVIHRLANELNDRFGGTAGRVSSPQGRFQIEADLLDGLNDGDEVNTHGTDPLDTDSDDDGLTDAEEITFGTDPDDADSDDDGLLDGTELVEAFARGKHLFVRFAEDRHVYIHLGLIGKLQFYPPEGGPNPARMRIANDHCAADLTGPQFCELVSRERVDEILAKSGPDPLDPDADPEVAWRKVHATSRPIAALMMDQALFAGVLVELMPLGVRDGRIDTVLPEHSPEAMGRDPRVDRHGGEVYVYRRASQPCLVCGSKVRTELLAGRNLYWCGRCQRRR